MKKMWQDFKKFIMRGNVVDMAIGVAVASAFTAIVTAFTKGFITPIIGHITGGIDLSDMKYVLREANEELGITENAILWGEFLQKVIDFLIIAVVFFIALRIFTAVTTHYAKVKQKIVDKLTDADEIAAAEAEAKAKAEAEAKAKAEAEAAEAARIECEKCEAEKARLERQEALLTEIRDLLAKKQ